MANYQQRQRAMSISTVSMDVDDMERLPRAEFRLPPHQPYVFNENPSLDSETRRDRFCFVMFIISLAIIALFSITGFIIAIYSLVLSKNNAATITTSTELIATTSPISCSTSPKTYYEYATSTPQQCLEYTINADPTRNIGFTSSVNFCDNESPFSNITSEWIRFQDPAGTLIVNSLVPPKYCGSIVSGWYAGQYPSALFTTATSIVCFYYTTDTCFTCSEISITKCQDFYVFLLPSTPGCNYRYCTI